MRHEKQQERELEAKLQHILIDQLYYKGENPGRMKSLARRANGSVERKQRRLLLPLFSFHFLLCNSMMMRLIIGASPPRVISPIFFHPCFSCLARNFTIFLVSFPFISLRFCHHVLAVLVTKDANVSF
jgi:hypothetical protein